MPFLNLARKRFQPPVAAHRRIAGGVVGGGDISVREFSDLVNELLTVGSSRNVAAVKQDVAILRQRLADRRKRRARLLAQALRIVVKVAKLQPAWLSMRDHMDRTDIAVGRCDRRDLIETGCAFRQAVD